jgi:hypothetical protein
MGRATLTDERRMSKKNTRPARRLALATALLLAAAALEAAKAVAEPMEFPAMPRSAAAPKAPEAAPSAFAGWDGKVGVDATPTAAPVALSPGATAADNQTGAGWATISLPSLPAAWDKASIDARINPADQAAVGIKLKQPVAKVGDFGVTIENNYSVSRPVDGDAHLKLPELPTQSITPTPAQSWQAGSALRLGTADTSVSFGSALSSDDRNWHSKMGFSHKLAPGLSISTEISDVETRETTASVTAGYKVKW